MIIENIATSELVEYENNPRNNEKAVEAVALSIKKFGFKVPIVIDSNKVIVCGHTRLRAAKLLGLKTVPCVIADDLTTEQINAFRLVDNKTSELASWDFEKLDVELLGLQAAGVDMSEFGFSVQDNVNIDDLFNELQKSESKKKKTIICQHCGEEFEV